MAAVIFTPETEITTEAEAELPARAPGTPAVIFTPETGGATETGRGLLPRRQAMYFLAKIAITGPLFYPLGQSWPRLVFMRPLNSCTLNS